MLNNQNKFYIIRLKENLNIIQKNNKDDDYITKHKNIDIRVIRYKINNNNYYLGTNLFDTNIYDINKLKMLYHKRWDIETFFRTLKTKLNLELNNIKDEISFNKLIFSQLIVSLLLDAFSHVFLDKLKCDKSSEYKINKSLLYDSFFNWYLVKIIKGEVSYKNLNLLITNKLVINNILIIY